MVNPGKAENSRSPKSLKNDGISIRSTFWCRIRNCIATFFVSHLVLILPRPAWALSKVVKKRSKMMFSRFLHKVGSMENEKMNPHMFITSTKIAQNRRSYRKIGTPEISALRGVTILPYGKYKLWRRKTCSPQQTCTSKSSIGNKFLGFL